jgi:hypothetical protein
MVDEVRSDLPRRIAEEYGSAAGKGDRDDFRGVSRRPMPSTDAMSVYGQRKIGEKSRDGKVQWRGISKYGNRAGNNKDRAELGRIDKWGRDGLMDVRLDYEPIRGAKMEESVRVFFDNWQNPKLADSEFDVKMRQGKDGSLWVDTERGKGEYSFPVWMITAVLGVNRGLVPESKVPVERGLSADMKRDLTLEAWQKLINRLVVNDIRRPKIKVEMTGPGQRKSKPVVVESRRVEPVERKENKVVHEVTVDLDRVDLKGADGVRKRVANGIGLMEMKKTRPSFEVRSDGRQRLLVKVKNGNFESPVIQVDDLLKTIPEVSCMGNGSEKHWSLNGLSVDASSKPEEWQRFLGSMRIKGRVKKRV